MDPDHMGHSYCLKYTDIHGKLSWQKITVCEDSYAYEYSAFIIELWNRIQMSKLDSTSFGVVLKVMQNIQIILWYIGG